MLLAASMLLFSRMDSHAVLSDEIEVLGQGEAVITCSAAMAYGRCFEVVNEGGIIPVYVCNWTGMQKDYCPFTIYMMSQKENQ